MAFRGGKPVLAELQEVVTARGQRPRKPPAPGKVIPFGGPPQMPATFDADHAKLWKRYITPAYWLTRVDEKKCVMIINLWHNYLKRGHDATPVVTLRELRCLGTELGFDPVARQRMSGEVMGRQERRSKRGRKRGDSKEHLAEYT